MGLEVHPALGIRTGKNGRSQGRVRRYGTLAGDDFTNMPLGYPKDFASLCCVIPMGFRKSPSRIPPG